MLSFILSKMNMLIFAVGIFVVVVAFMQFIEANEVTESANALLRSNVEVISKQLSPSDLCATSKPQVLPGTLRTGINNYLYYQLIFSKQEIGTKDGITKRKLVLSLLKKGTDKIIASKSVVTDAKIIFIGPEIVAPDIGVDEYYYDETNESIILDPRAESPIDAFVALKEVVDGEQVLYIIPCSSAINYSCKYNVVKVGCYNLKTNPPQGIPLTDNTPVGQCFATALDIPSVVGRPEGVTVETCKSIGVWGG